MVKNMFYITKFLISTAKKQSLKSSGICIRGGQDVLQYFPLNIT